MSIQCSLRGLFTAVQKKKERRSKTTNVLWHIYLAQKSGHTTKSTTRPPDSEDHLQIKASED